MPTPKFDEIDRTKVIAEISDHLGIRLTPVRKYKRFLEDEQGRPYWVLGGYDEWHGITAKMLEETKNRPEGGVLVIAKRYKTKIEIFVGSLQPMLDQSSRLSHPQSGDYQFNVAIRANLMTIKEVEGLVLRKLGTPMDVGPPTSAGLRHFEVMMAKLSPEERLKLLEQLAETKKG